MDEDGGQAGGLMCGAKTERERNAMAAEDGEGNEVRERRTINEQFYDSASPLRLSCGLRLSYR